MRKFALCVGLAGFVLVLGATSSWAQDQQAKSQQQQQQQQQQQPTTEKPADNRVAPPAAPVAPLGTENSESQRAETDQNQSAPTTPGQRSALSGVEQYMLNTMGRGHNYFYPALQVAESGDTNANNQIGSTTFDTVSTVSGLFALNHIWSRYTLSADYAGSGFIDNRDVSNSSSAHAFSLSQTILGARSSLLLTDAVSYLPESSFGFARFGNFGDFGIGGFSAINSSGLNGIYVPNQSILTGDSTRVSNTVVGEYDYRLSPLSSLTFTGSYGILRFLDTSFIDSNAGIFGFGFNRSLTPRDSIAVTYMGTLYRYDQSANDFDTHIAALIYGHQISHLFSLRLGAGPQINRFTGSSTSNSTLVSWYATASLAYRVTRTGLGISYTHYTSEGAGVFLGAKTDNLGVSIDRQLSRMWSAALNMGYSHNTSLTATSTLPTFNTWYASANLQRPLGHYTTAFLSYNLQQQSSNNPFCTGSGCGSFYTRNYFSIGLAWHPSQVEIGGTN